MIGVRRCANIKNGNIPVCSAAWMDPENIVLSEVRQAEKDKYVTYV